jgi:DNA-directed RNA polymerase alpha subunit
LLVRRVTCSRCKGTGRVTDPVALAAELPLAKLTLSVRARNTLLAVGIKTVGDLMKLTEAELRKVKDMTELTMQEVRVEMKRLGVKLRG